MEAQSTESTTAQWRGRIGRSRGTSVARTQGRKSWGRGSWPPENM